MNFHIIDVEQRSAEWFTARCGRFTSSNAADIFKEGRKKGEESFAKRDLRIRLALERMTNRAQDEDPFVTKEMQRGIDTERAARLAYEARTGDPVMPSGFLAHTRLLAGTSLDGYVGEFEGVTEFKCPKSATHIVNIKSKAIPSEYIPQIRHHLWMVPQAEWCDFVSFDDRLPEPLQLAIVRAYRKDLDIPGYDAAARQFLADVDAEVAALTALTMAAVA